jgi:hypothetical protein
MSCNNKEDKEIPMRTISTSIMAVIFAVCFVLAANSHFAEGAEMMEKKSEMMMEKGEMKVKNWAAGAEMMEKEGEMMMEKGKMMKKEGEMMK